MSKMKDFKVEFVYPATMAYYVTASTVEDAIKEAKGIDEGDDPATPAVDYDAKPTVVAYEADSSVESSLPKWKQVKTEPDKPTYDELENLLRQVVDSVAVAENTSGQLEKLYQMGFSDNMLLFFGYSQNDIDAYLRDNGNN